MDENIKQEPFDDLFIDKEEQPSSDVDIDLTMNQIACSDSFIKEEPRDNPLTNNEGQSNTFVLDEGDYDMIHEITVKEECISSSEEEADEEVNAEEQSTSTGPKKKENTTRRKVMGSQARELIAMVYYHMKKEALNGVENVTDARWRTCQATGVSEKTVSRILREKRIADANGTPMRSPHRNKKPRKCLRRDIAETDKDVIKHTIHTFQSEFNKPPTLIKLKSVLKERINFNGCIETLRRILVEIGYDIQLFKNSFYHQKLLEETRK